MIPFSSGDKHVIDVVSAIVAVGGFMGDVLPSVVLLLTGIWTLLRIFETDTMQRMMGRSKDAEESESE